MRVKIDHAGRIQIPQTVIKLLGWAQDQLVSIEPVVARNGEVTHLVIEKAEPNGQNP